MSEQQGGPQVLAGVFPRIKFRASEILQALVIFAGMAGWAIAGYYTIQQQIGAHEKEISLLKQRLDQDERLAQQFHAEDRSFDAETRSYLDRISGQIADLRALIAAKK